MNNDKPTGPDVPDDLIDTKAAARLAHTHINTVRRWMIKRKIPAWRRTGRWFVSRADILALWQHHAERPQEAKQPAPTTRRHRNARQRWAERVLKEAGIG
jgi:helix-turn-helix protein